MRFEFQLSIVVVHVYYIMTNQQTSKYELWHLLRLIVYIVHFILQQIKLDYILIGTNQRLDQYL